MFDDSLSELEKEFKAWLISEGILLTGNEADRGVRRRCNDFIHIFFRSPAGIPFLNQQFDFYDTYKDKEYDGICLEKLNEHFNSYELSGFY